ncbi:MAG: hypothetical protein P1V51_22425 [Deltaproteobacteria bacterium]|nr:hypothetical protein [Deltaproteobacteria bacterium]
MRAVSIGLLAALAFAPACGLSEHEQGPEAGTLDLPGCPERAAPVAPDRLSPSGVRLRARMLERFFVDECHHALLLEPLEVLEGELREPVLAIVPGAVSEAPPLDPEREVEVMLEPDPEIPEVYRALGL